MAKAPSSPISPLRLRMIRQALSDEIFLTASALVLAIAVSASTVGIQLINSPYLLYYLIEPR